MRASFFVTHSTVPSPAAQSAWSIKETHVTHVSRRTMASAQWNRAQQGAYRGGYDQQTSYITGNRSRLIRCNQNQLDHCVRLDFLAHVTCFAARISLAMQNQKDLGCTSLFPRAISVPTFFWPRRSANHHSMLIRYSLEKLGKFYLMLEAGMHILVPFVDQITFTRCLKTGLLDCPPQVSQFQHSIINFVF